MRKMPHPLSPLAAVAQQQQQQHVAMTTEVVETCAMGTSNPLTPMGSARISAANSREDRQVTADAQCTVNATATPLVVLATATAALSGSFHAGPTDDKGEGDADSVAVAGAEAKRAVRAEDSDGDSKSKVDKSNVLDSSDEDEDEQHSHDKRAIDSTERRSDREAKEESTTLALDEPSARADLYTSRQQAPSERTHLNA